MIEKLVNKVQVFPAWVFQELHDLRNSIEKRGIVHLRISLAPAHATVREYLPVSATAHKYEVILLPGAANQVTQSLLNLE